MVNTSEFDFGGWRLFTGRAESIFTFQFWYCDISEEPVGLRGRTPSFVIFVVWSALIAGGWVGGGI